MAVTNRASYSDETCWTVKLGPILPASVSSVLLLASVFALSLSEESTLFSLRRLSLRLFSHRARGRNMVELDVPKEISVTRLVLGELKMFTKHQD